MSNHIQSNDKVTVKFVAKKNVISFPLQLSKKKSTQLVLKLPKK